MMKKILRWAIYAIVAGVAIAWIAGEVLIQRANPPERFAGTIVSPEADILLRRACFDCHSNETVYPWYSYFPVASLLLAQHVRDGRRELNFSRWSILSTRDRGAMMEKSLDTLQDGSMAPWDYRLLHPEARLTAADVAMLQQGAATTFGTAMESHKKGKGKDKERGARLGREGREKHDDDDDD